jgi:hypothetical protein
MANPWAGEVAIEIDGVVRPMKLTLGALADLEAGLGEASLIALVERFEAGRFSARDVLALIVAGLRGGGWAECSVAGLAAADIGGGAVGAARAAAALLARSFALPGEGGHGL